MADSQSKSKGSEIATWCKNNQLVCVLIIVIVILVIWKVFMSKERMAPFYLDQIAMQASNPTIVKYLGNERDPLGMSLRDYYLESTMNAGNTVAPQYDNDMAFANHTSYLQMPRYYRPEPGYKPKPLAALLKGDNVSTVTPSIDSVNTQSVDGILGSGSESFRSSIGSVAANKALNNLNQKNQSGRERFLH